MEDQGLSLKRYEGKSVKIQLHNGYFYKGYVVSVWEDDGSIELIDVAGHMAVFKPAAINFIITVKENYNPEDPDNDLRK